MSRFLQYILGFFRRKTTSGAARLHEMKGEIMLIVRLAQVLVFTAALVFMTVPSPAVAA
jgi:hypothetical protein